MYVNGDLNGSIYFHKRILGGCVSGSQWAVKGCSYQNVTTALRQE